MAFKLRAVASKSKAAKKVQEETSDPYNEFEQYEDFALDDCYEEQNRLLKAIDQLVRDKKVWTGANTSAQNDLKKKLNHLTYKVEYLQAGTNVEFAAFVSEKLKEKDASAKKRLKVNKKN